MRLQGIIVFSLSFDSPVYAKMSSLESCHLCSFDLSGQRCLAGLIYSSDIRVPKHGESFVVLQFSLIDASQPFHGFRSVSRFYVSSFSWYTYSYIRTQPFIVHTRIHESLISLLSQTHSTVVRYVVQEFNLITKKEITQAEQRGK